MNRSMSRMPWMTTVAVALAAAGVLRADALDRALLLESPKIIEYLRKHHCHTVGVLKFLVKKAGENETDSAGILNLGMAQRLELALILCDDNPAGKPAEQIAVLQDASAVADRTPGANHTDPTHRKPLFDASYPVAWGKKMAHPDVLLAGVIHLSEDRQKFQVNVYAYHRDSPEEKPKKVVSFDAPADPSALSETGESFQLRGIADDATLKLEPEEREKAIQKEAAAAALRAKEVHDQHPAAPAAETPVVLKILYDGKLQNLKFVGGVAEVAEPAEGQKVVFVLERRDSSKTAYGVVLKVNGENTLERERKRDLQCIKWILEPGDGPTHVRGFQKGDTVADKFRILSRPESKEKEFYYGADVGLITMAVFRNRDEKSEPPPRDPKDSFEEEDERALQRGMFPAERPEELSRLKELLRKEKSETRGLIGSGPEVESKVQTVKFTADPTPVMAISIRYYKP
jgi:hypothetical protein